MSLLRLGLLLIVVGIVLWATVAPALGGALILVGVVLMLVAAITGHRAGPPAV